MDYRYKQLEQELLALSKVFGELGARLSEVAKEVTAPGVMPPEKLPDQISTARTHFDSIRSAVHGHAASMLVSPLPKITEVMSVVALDSLLKAAAAAEENRYSIEDERERTLGILGRVLAIAHREAGDFKPLQECHAKIGELRNTIAKVAWPHRHAESESIIGMKHPATALLSFVENVDTLDDERWIALETTITEHYGKPLFVAASRGKLALPVSSAKPVAASSAPVKPAPVAEKPAEKKVVAEKAPEKPAAVAAPPAPANIEKKVVAQPAPAVQAPARPAAPAAQPVATPLSAPPAPAVAHVSSPVAPAPAVASTPIAPVATAQVSNAAAPVAPAPVAAPTSVATAPAAPVAAAPVSAVPVPPRPAAPVAQSVPAPAAQAAAPSAPATQTATIHSLSALATATEPPTDRKPATAPPVENGDRQRKEPRLAAPSPQLVARLETKPQEQELMSEEAQKADNGDGSQRPQRWGFWRGNR